MSKNFNTTLNDDLQFLVNCCKTNPTQEDTNNILTYLNNLSLPTNTMPRQEMPLGCTSLANSHGVLPLVYKTLKSLNAERLTPNANNSTPSTLPLKYLLSDLKSEYSQIAHRNMLMSAELIRIMKLLEENHIEALAFKGPTLAQMAYGDITLRQYVDLDILVDESDAFKAGKLMSENGHIAILPLTILSNTICLHTAKDFSLMSEAGGVHTELHWRLFEKKYNISLLSCAIDKKCQTVKINNNKIKTLQNELLLVYLCLHGAKHTFERIEWICDIDRLIRNSTVNWEETISISNQSHAERSFYLGLSLAHHLFYTTLPSNIIQNINSDNIKILQSMTLKQMSEKNNDRSDVQKNKDTFFYQAKLFDQKSDMLRFYLSTFFKISTNDCQTFVLPEKLKFLYIILRPIRLVWNYTQKIFKK